MEAGSKEWHAFRSGRFTASECHKLMGEKGGITTATAQTYIMEKVAETLTGGWHEEMSTPATRWGKEMELEAAMYYELAFNCEVIKPDPQSPEWSNEVSTSPDGIVLLPTGVHIGQEYKCPYNPTNHAKHMLIRSVEDLKSANKEAYWQIVMNMLVWQLDWEFISFDPRFSGDKRMHVVEIKRSQVESDIGRLYKSLLEAIKVKHEYLKRIEM